MFKVAAVLFVIYAYRHRVKFVPAGNGKFKCEPNGSFLFL
nr:MAG TPA: hypothetical protein [Caudoviricetes sp.]